MDISQVCRDLFQKNGQIGYYLLGCQLERGDEASGGTVSAREWNHSAKQRL